METRFPVKIRKFKREDVDEILDIEQEAFPKTPYPKEVFLHYAKTLPNGFVVIGRGQGIDGYVVFHEEGHILSMAVRAGQRRKGLGRRLFAHTLERLQNRPWLEVRSKNRGAIAFYKKMEMKAVGRRPGYYGDDDAVIMALAEGEGS
jgi:ribosomal-protein-alanine N-acetyltransferase